MVVPMTIILWVSTVVVTIFSVLGCVGNIIAVRVWSNGQLCKAIPFAGYFRYLAMADLLTIVLWVYPTFIGYSFNATLAATSDVLCPIMLFLTRFVVCVSLWIMVALLVDRSGCHVRLCSPDGAKRRSHIVCAIVVMLMALVFVPQFIFSKRLSYIIHQYVEPQYGNEQLLTTTQRYHWHINGTIDIFDKALDYPTNSSDYSSPNDQPMVRTVCFSDDVPVWIVVVQIHIVQLYTPPVLAFLCAILLAIICSSSASKQLDPDHRVTLLICVLGWVFSATRGLNMIPYQTFNSEVGYAIYFTLALVLFNSSNVVNSLLYFMLPDYRHDVRLMFSQAPAQHQHEDRINNQELTEIK